MRHPIILKMQWQHEKYRFWYIYKMFSKFIFWLGYGKKYFSMILKNSISIIWSSKNTEILCSRTLVLACSCSKSYIYTFHYRPKFVKYHNISLGNCIWVLEAVGQNYGPDSFRPGCPFKVRFCNIKKTKPLVSINPTCLNSTEIKCEQK